MPGLKHGWCMKRKSASGRIFPGAYCLPADRTPAQRAFFSAIKRKAPEVLESLHDEILPAFKRLCDAGSVGRRLYLELYPLVWDWAVHHQIITGDRLIPVIETCRGLSDVEIEAKYTAFGNSPEQTFFFSWAWFAIVGTMVDWIVDPRKKNALEWTMPIWPYPIGDGWGLLSLRTNLDQPIQLEDLFIEPKKSTAIPFTFSVAAWNPRREPRGKAKDRILAQVVNDLDRQMDQVEALMRHFDVPKAPTKFNTDHFDWLVLYQIHGKHFAEIAEADPHKPNHQTIADGVKDAALLVIGPAWKHWLRPSKPGRPKTT